MSFSCKFAVPALAAILLAGGCASNRGEIPGGADLVAEGNERLTYEIRDAGTIYIYDDTANRLVYSGDVKRGETIAIDTRADSIMIDTRRAGEWDLDPDHRYQIFIDEPRRERGRVVVEERTYRRD